MHITEQFISELFTRPSILKLITDSDLGFQTSVKLSKAPMLSLTFRHLPLAFLDAWQSAVCPIYCQQSQDCGRLSNLSIYWAPEMAGLES